MPEQLDVAIIGGGISGVSLAARLAERARVVVLEAEDHFGTHATGRSAALLVQAYGPPVIRTLTRISRPFFESPPADFAGTPLSRIRGGLVYAAEGELEELATDFDLASHSTEVVWLDSTRVTEECPLLRPGIAAAGFLEPHVLDLDTNALLQGFVRTARRAGASFHLSARVENVLSTADGWLIALAEREIACGTLVNAAGAWADGVAALAGAATVGLQPMRRTAATVPVPEEIRQLLPRLPFVAPVEESFYFKPEVGSIMVSLADETPCEACDAYPEDLDVAIALERFHQATIVPRTRPTATWAGLRTFPPDRVPVVGFDAEASGFFWYAGQGGFGIQTSPALSALGAKLIVGDELSEKEAELAAEMRPDRPALLHNIRDIAAG
jgi:D-arginine dehydrogenase